MEIYIYSYILIVFLTNSKKQNSYKVTKLQKKITSWVNIISLINVWSNLPDESQLCSSGIPSSFHVKKPCPYILITVCP